MKIMTVLTAALVLGAAATSASACSGTWKQTTAQNQEKVVLPSQGSQS